MEATSHIIQYIADLKDVKSKLREINKINKTIAKEFGQDFTRATSIVSSSLDKISRKPITVKGKRATQTMQTFNTVVKTANGSLKTVSQTVTKVNGKFKGLSSSISNGAKVTRGFGANLATLVKRASLTIPVWFLLRGSIQAVAGAMKEGFASLIAFDRALQKAKQNLSGSANEIEANFQKLRAEVQKLAVETGTSVVKVTNAFQKFATVGFDFETSIAGATQATKLAVALFGDAEQNANALARAFRVLEDKSEDAKAPSEQLAIITAQLADLWKDNAFEINEMAGALERFAPVANIANFTIHETIALLASLQTAGIRGTRAGRLLSTAVLQLDKNFDKINKTLGLDINPKLTDTFDRFRLVLGAIAELNKVDKIGASKAVQELFGGVRGAQIGQALIAVDTLVEKNLARTGDINKFNKSFEEVTNTISKQVDIFKELKTEIFRLYVSGIVGGDDFNETMKQVNETLERTKKIAVAIAKAQKFLFKLQVGSIAGEDIGLPQIDFDIINPDFGKIASEFAINLNDEIVFALRKSTDADKIFEVFQKAVDASFAGKFEVSDRVLGELLAQMDKVLDAEKLIGKGDFGATLTESFTNKQNVIKAVIDSQLDILKTQGASNAQLLKAEGLLNTQLGLKQSAIDILTRELNLEKEIANEKRLQNTLGSESLKLFRIAKTSGADIARDIGDVLSGDTNFDSFVKRGGKALSVFKKKFGDVYEQELAKKFFKGEGALRGGSDIDIQERAGLDAVRIFSPKATIALNRALDRFSELKFPDQEIENMVVKNLTVPGGVIGVGTSLPKPIEDIPILPNAITNKDLTATPLTNIPLLQNALTNKDLNQFAQPSTTSVLKIEFGGGEEISLIGTKESITKQIADLVVPVIINKSTELLESSPNHPLTKAVGGVEPN